MMKGIDLEGSISSVILSYYPSTCLYGLRKIAKNLS
jgi:hypothetical protein